MRYSIAAEIIRYAFVLKLAAAMTKDELKKIIQELKAIFNNKDNFVKPKPDSFSYRDDGVPFEESTTFGPKDIGHTELSFSPKGLEKIKALEFPPRIAKDVIAVLKLLDNAINLAGKTGNEEMAYLSKILEKDKAKWLTNVRSLGGAQDSLDFISEAMEKEAPRTGPLTPEEYKDYKRMKKEKLIKV